MAASYIPSFLQVVAVSDYKRQPPVGYFSLPAELRKMVLEIALSQEQVFLDSSKPVKRQHKLSLLHGTSHYVTDTGSKNGLEDSICTRVLQPSGFQFLATCRQACVEGYAIFYYSNTFFLPPGPLENTLHGLETVQRQHQAMIKKLGLTMGLQDLPPTEESKQILRELVRLGPLDRDRALDYKRFPPALEVTTQLVRIWKAKLNFVMTVSKELNVLEIGHAEGSQEFRATTTQNTNGEESREFRPTALKNSPYIFDKEDDEGMLGTPEMHDLVWNARRVVSREIVMPDLKAYEVMVQMSASEVAEVGDLTA